MIRKSITGRIDRRGNFIAEGVKARAVFGRAWRDKGLTARERVRVSVEVGKEVFAGIVYSDSAVVTLPRRF